MILKRVEKKSVEFNYITDRLDRCQVRAQRDPSIDTSRKKAPGEITPGKVPGKIIRWVSYSGDFPQDKEFLSKSFSAMRLKEEIQEG